MLAVAGLVAGLVFVHSRDVITYLTYLPSRLTLGLITVLTPVAGGRSGQPRQPALVHGVPDALAAAGDAQIDRRYVADGGHGLAIHGDRTAVRDLLTRGAVADRAEPADPAGDRGAAGRGDRTGCHVVGGAPSARLPGPAPRVDDRGLRAQRRHVVGHPTHHGARVGARPRRGPGSKQHKINDWLPCPGVVLPGLVGCLDPA